MSNDVPSGPPPSEPPAGISETLDSHGGVRVTSSGPAPARSRRTTVIAVAALVGAAAVGGAAWAAWSFFSTGAQPAEALPDSTIAYASVDLDPSGGQKIEALRTLKKFPAFEDEVGLETDDDIREWIFDQLQDGAGCDSLDYGDDIEPWLGDRFAVAAVDTGEDQPAPVFVVQVTDADGADEGLGKLRDCGGGDSDDVAWSIDGDWALLGEDQKTVDAIAADAADDALADDEDFQEWTGAAGDDGIIAMYAAPAAGAFLADNLAGLGAFGTTYAQEATSDGSAPTEISENPAPDELTDTLKDFKGAAATIRFDDGGLELEMAADPAATGKAVTAGDEGGAAVSTLPDDTAAAIGVSFEDGWVADIFDQIAESTGESGSDMMAEVGERLGLDLPDDAETLLGDSVALAVDGDFDPSSVFGLEGETGASGVGVKILGDADEIDDVLDRLRTSAGGADGGILDSDAGDDVVAIGPDADYRAVLLEDGGLGDSGTFRDVVEHADDAAAVFYVNFGAGDDWLAELAGDDTEARDNLAPLKALGMSAWVDDDVAHAVLKVTTD